MIFACNELGVTVDVSLPMAKVSVYCMVKYVVKYGVHIGAWPSSGVLALKQARGASYPCDGDGAWGMYVVAARHLSVLSVVAGGLFVTIG